MNIVTFAIMRLRRALRIKKYAAYRELRKRGISIADSLQIARRKRIVAAFETGGKSVLTDWRDARALGVLEQKTADWIRNIGTRDTGAVFYDIGAHIGKFSILADAVGLRVYAFEPHPANFHTLFQNQILNKGMFVPIHCAVGNACGIQKFDMGTKWSGSCSFDNRSVHRKTTHVLAITLNDTHKFLGLPRPQYVKIDTDGDEQKITEHADLSSVKEIAIEISSDLIRKEIHRILTREGFFLFDEEHFVKGKGYPRNEFWRKRQKL